MDLDPFRTALRRGEAALFFKTKEGVKQLTICFTNKGLEGFDEAYEKAYPEKSFNLAKIFLTTGYRPKIFKIFCLNCQSTPGDEPLTTEAEIDLLTDQDPMHWKQNWITLQRAYARWCEMPGVEEAIARGAEERKRVLEELQNDAGKQVIEVEPGKKTDTALLPEAKVVSSTREQAAAS